ncbi:probable F-box protein At5g47300 [Capsella rubella]|uniref:probable F-box protein At5g47300 n=1 Tax=Capsella rubella TaxID=81985 RepID=UPI000CD5B1CA|nr:probable F-box protein At5g47300 [Capsella rubella]
MDIGPTRNPKEPSKQPPPAGTFLLEKSDLLLMSDLPGDLVEEILCRVPATSLSQLRYTCKQWNNIFNNRTFTRKHSDKAAKQFQVLMLKHNEVCMMSVNFCGVPSIEIKGEYGLTNPQATFEIFQVSHCEGLLLCTNRRYSRIVVWNPCTGETNWLRPRKRGWSCVLGSYQDKNYGGNSYKILSFPDGKYKRFAIYEINTKVWKTLDVTLDCKLECFDYGKSLKGKTYWFAFDKNEEQLGMFLVSFDYTREIFERLLLPCLCRYYEAFSVSVVREEKLSVLLQNGDASKTEIWVTNKIDNDTKVVSWSKFLTVDLKAQLCIGGFTNFLVDEEKKFIVVCQCSLLGDFPIKQVVYIGGEDNKVIQVYSGYTSSLQCLFYYVPSLTQISCVSK